MRLIDKTNDSTARVEKSSQVDAKQFRHPATTTYNCSVFDIKRDFLHIFAIKWWRCLKFCPNQGLTFTSKHAKFQKNRVACSVSVLILVKVSLSGCSSKKLFLVQNRWKNSLKIVTSLWTSLAQNNWVRVIRTLSSILPFQFLLLH